MDERKKRRIERQARNLLEENDLFQAGFDIFDLLDQLDIQYVIKDLGEKIYGASRVDENGKIISLNSRNHINRRRFSAAHELGHIFLHQEKSLNYSDRLVYKVMYRDENSSTGSDWREIEANYFAACLLMPKELVEAEIECSDFELDEDQIESLAKKFGVSPIALGIRLSSLGYT